MKKIILSIILIITCLITISISFLFLKTGTPVKSLKFKSCKSKQPHVLIIFLPGMVDEPEDFNREGFVDIVKKSSLHADIIITDAHIGYYLRGTLIERLNEDFIIHARKKGYSEIWLVGFSLGGLGALLYACDDSNNITGALAIAPFMGSSGFINDIIQAGGIKEWMPERPINHFDLQTYLWSRLKDYINSPQQKPAIYIGFGKNDTKIIKSNSLFANALPEKQVFQVAGKHEWKPWREIFTKFINSIINRTNKKKIPDTKRINRQSINP